MLLFICVTQIPPKTPTYSSYSSYYWLAIGVLLGIIIVVVLLHLAINLLFKSQKSKAIAIFLIITIVTGLAVGIIYLKNYKLIKKIELLKSYTSAVNEALNETMKPLTSDIYEKNKKKIETEINSQIINSNIYLLQNENWKKLDMKKYADPLKFVDKTSNSTYLELSKLKNLLNNLETLIAKEKGVVDQYNSLNSILESTINSIFKYNFDDITLKFQSNPSIYLMKLMQISLIIETLYKYYNLSQHLKTIPIIAIENKNGYYFPTYFINGNINFQIEPTGFKMYSGNTLIINQSSLDSLPKFDNNVKSDGIFYSINDSNTQYKYEFYNGIKNNKNYVMTISQYINYSNITIHTSFNSYILLIQNGIVLRINCIEKDTYGRVFNRQYSLQNKESFVLDSIGCITENSERIGDFSLKILPNEVSFLDEKTKKYLVQTNNEIRIVFIETNGIINILINFPPLKSYSKSIPQSSTWNIESLSRNSLSENINRINDYQ